MSSAFYPLGMKSYNNHVPQGGYKSWKGTGVLSSPVGTSAGHIRPLTNNDPGNVFQTGFGLARPIKHYRKGRVIAYPLGTTYTNSANQEQNIETSLIYNNINRNVKSSTGSSLGGGSGGRGLLNQMMDNPGSFSIIQNNTDEITNINKLDTNCKTCQGVGIISDYYPNNTYLTENPTKTTTTNKFCCNEERKARKRVLPASTLLKKNYYTTLQQYRENRCKTFEQRSFNFQTPDDILIQERILNIGNPFITEAVLKAVKPGGPLSELNTYFANCQPNAEIYQASEINIVARFLNILNVNSILTIDEIQNSYTVKTIQGLYNFLSTLPIETKEIATKIFLEYLNNPYVGVPFSGPSNPVGCKLVVYKPNNSQYAQEGAVLSSTRMLKLNVTTIQKNLTSFNNNAQGINLTHSDVAVGTSRTIPFILKNKAPTCQTQTYITQFQNPKTCFRGQNDNMNKMYNISNYGQTPPSYYDALYE